MIRTVTFSTLYPNELFSHHGIFVEQRLRHLLASGEVESSVIAPVPWFPVAQPWAGSYAKFAVVPKTEKRYGIDILHPRYPLIPKIGMTIAPILMASALRNLMRSYSRTRGFDLIDAHYLYPDGVAAAMLGRWLNKPVVITARGTDVNLIPKYTWPRKWIKWVVNECGHIITVSDALRERLIELGAESRKIRTLRNGVDLNFFRPLADRNAIRAKYGISKPTLLSVGHLIERKGHHLVIKALAALPDTSLIIVGSGEMRTELENLAKETGVISRVRFAGSLPHSRLVEYYNAADVLVLASSREGMANVVLESIACGTPVVGTPVWGTPEVIRDSRAGILARDRSVSSIVAGVIQLMNNLPPRQTVREFATQFGWEPTTQGQIEIFRRVLSGNSENTV